MIRSMTGFGEASAHEGGTHYFLEVRSLNGKYFKATLRLPEDLQGLEPELDSELRRRLTRGTITLIGKCSNASASAAYTINQGALDSYVAQIRKTKGIADGSGELDIAALLGLPGVLQPPSDEEERFARARRVFMTLTDKACIDLIKMREREGALLVQDLTANYTLIVTNLAKIKARAPQVVLDYQARLLTRIDGLLKDAKTKVEPEDLIREVAVYAERSDIAEEIARLSGHMDQFKSLLTEADGRPIGRTLDFLTQEMLREANTVASKSGDADISRNIVEIKGAIDRIKEQVQNVE